MSVPCTPDRGCAVDVNGRLKDSKDIEWAHSPSQETAQGLSVLNRNGDSPSSLAVSRRTRAQTVNKKPMKKKAPAKSGNEKKRKSKKAKIEEEPSNDGSLVEGEESSDEETARELLNRLEAFADADRITRTKSSKTDDIRLVFQRQDRIIDNMNVKGHICMICMEKPQENKVWYAGGNSTLRSHIARFDNHHMKYLELCEEKNITPHPRALPEKVSGAQQLSLEAFVKRNPIYTPERLLYYLIELIVSDDQARQSRAFLLLDKPAFRNILLFMRPSTRESDVPHRTKITKEVLEKARQVVYDLKIKFKQVKGLISFTFDSWTSRAGDPYLAVTAHYVSHPPNQPTEWTLENALIAFPFISGNHGGDNIAKIITKAIDRYDLRSKIGWFTSDNASVNDTTMVSLTNPGMAAEDIIGFDAQDRRVRCAAHVLNLAARAFIEGIAPTPASVIRKKLIGVKRKRQSIYDDDSGVDDELLEEETPFGAPDDDDDGDMGFDASDLLGKVLALIFQIRASPQASAYFKECCEKKNIKPQKLKKWVRTRWSSMYEMLLRLLELQPAINFFTSRADVTKQVPKLNRGRNYKMFAITATEWEQLTRITKVLNEPARAQNDFSSEHKPTVWRTIPALECLQTTWETYSLLPEFSSVKAGLDRGLGILKKYYKLTDNTSVNLICLVLHPAFKLVYINKTWDAEWIKDARKTLNKIVEAYQQQEDTISADDAPVQGGTASMPVNKIGGYGSAWMQDAVKQATTPAVAEKKSELEQYLTKPLEDVEDVLLWWGRHSREYPTLSRIARDYLAIQGSAVPSERSFSSGGLTGTDRRNHLNQNTFEALQILKSAFRNNNVMGPPEPFEDENMESDIDVLAIPPTGKA